MPAYCLDMHAAYRCRHVGACCTADWLIPAEAHVLHIVETRGIGVKSTDALFVDEGTERTVARRSDGTCVFFERDRGRVCAIHRHAGPDALPSACRHFPREVLIDPRGTFISLSHFCPTAAGLLLLDGRLAVIRATAPLCLDEPIEGLDATAAMPPLVRPGLLADLDGYDAWEKACLATLARPELTSDEALDLIAGATEDVRGWQPAEGALSGHVRDAFDRAVARAWSAETFAALATRHFPPAAAPLARFDDVWEQLVAPTAGSFDQAIRKYAAARLFGNWIAYQGRGLRSVVEWLRTAVMVLRHELARRAAASGLPPVNADFIAAVGAADWLLLHTLDSEDVARHFTRLEGPEPA